MNGGHDARASSVKMVHLVLYTILSKYSKEAAALLSSLVLLAVDLGTFVCRVVLTLFSFLFLSFKTSTNPRMLYL